MTTSKTTVQPHEQIARELGREQVHGLGELGELGELRDQPQSHHSLNQGYSFNLELSRDPHSGQPEPALHPEFEF